MSLSVGSRLGPYEILAPLGAGGMGEVYCARDQRLKRDVAIKVLPASFSADADRLRRFEQEAQAAGSLNHPNITAVYDIGTHEEAPYVVQELLEGETLRARLSGGAIAVRKAIDYAVQIAKGLAAAHEKGIVHRDLKPENLFLTNDGRVKILDFGLAKLTQPEGESGLRTNLPTAAAATEPGVVMGTLGYMSPEQVKGKPADQRSDLFSFGAILYEMLSGVRAFHRDSAAWDGKPMEIFVGRPESPESRPFGLAGAEVLAISNTGGMAVSLGRRVAGGFRRSGTLAQLSVAGGSAPRDILKEVEWADWSPDGKSLAIVRTVSGKMRLEYPAGKLLYETSGWVSHPRISPDGSLIAFIDHPTPDDDGGAIAAVDRSGRVKKLSEPFASAQGLAWSPKGEVWFTATRVGGNRSLHSTTRGGTVRERARVPGTLTLQDISRDGRLLVTRDTLRGEMVVLPPGESKERDFTWLDWSLPAAISADGKRILFYESGEGGGAGYSVYVRSTDGSPAVRLGEGSAQDLSADGEWALAIVHSASDPQLVAYPTGAGEPKLFSKEGLSVYGASFMPDGKQIVLTASEPGHGPRIYLRSLDGGKPRAVTPEGYTGGVVAPDGKWIVAAGPDRKRYLYPLSGGEPTAVPGLDREDRVDQRSLDGRFLFVHRSGEMPARVFRLDLSTGRKEPWRTLMPADAAGVSRIDARPTPGGEAYVYNYFRTLSDLYLVEGVK